MSEYLMPHGIHTISSHGISFTGDADGVIDVTGVSQAVLDDIVAHAGVTIRLGLPDGQHTEEQLKEQAATQLAIEDAVRRASTTPIPLSARVIPEATDTREGIDGFFSRHANADEVAAAKAAAAEAEEADEVDEAEEADEEDDKSEPDAAKSARPGSVMPPKRAKAVKRG